MGRSIKGIKENNQTTNLVLIAILGRGIPIQEYGRKVTRMSRRITIPGIECEPFGVAREIKRHLWWGTFGGFLPLGLDR